MRGKPRVGLPASWALSGACVLSCRFLSLFSLPTAVRHFHVSDKREDPAAEPAPAGAAAVPEKKGWWEPIYAVPLGIAVAVPALHYEWLLITEETQVRSSKGTRESERLKKGRKGRSWGDRWDRRPFGISYVPFPRPPSSKNSPPFFLLNSSLPSSSRSARRVLHRVHRHRLQAVRGRHQGLSGGGRQEAPRNAQPPRGRHHRDNPGQDRRPPIAGPDHPGRRGHL
jgi:hypothetical protein